MLNKKRLSTLSSVLVSPLSAYLFYVFFDQYPTLVRIVGMIVAGLSAGLVLGSVFGADCYKSIRSGAFIGVCLLSIPVVLASYGFALLGLPLLMAYASCVSIGAKCGARAYAVAPPRNSA